MNLRLSGLLAIAGLVVGGLLGITSSRAQNGYITNQDLTNQGSSTASVIDTPSNTVTATIPLGGVPSEDWRC